MEGWVAVTHSDWFDFLARQPHREEVNFWSPSDYYTFHGTPGALFFFKLKAPRNVRQPADWAPRNLRYTRYDLTVGEGARVWRVCQERAASLAPTEVEFTLVTASDTSRYGAPVLMRPRLG